MLWVGWRPLALAARGAFADGGDGIEPLWALPIGVAGDVALVVLCFAWARALATAQHPRASRWRWLPAALLATSAVIRTVDLVHGYLGMSHVSVGFWWHVSWSQWPLLVESGAIVAIGVAAGWAWFGVRALGRDVRRPRRGPSARLASVVALVIFAGSAALVDHSQHAALLPEINTPRTWLAFVGFRPPPSTVDVDAATWQRWQTAGLVPTSADRTSKWPLYHRRPPPRPARAGRQPDVVLVFLESFNAGLTSPYGGDELARKRGHSGPLTPQLARLAKRASVVHGYYTQARPTHFGLVASLCGLLPGSWPLDTRLADRPPPALSCLPEHLERGTRRTLFVQGSSLEYTGMGRMLRRFGFDEVHGRHALSERFPDAPRNAWGLHDREVIAFAAERIRALRAASEPYLLTLMTVDSHLPGTARPDCQPPAPLADNAILRAIHCADGELAALLDLFDELDLWRDTLLVVTADHAMQATPALRDLIGAEQADPFASIPLLVHDPAGRLPRRWQTHGGQVDLARTVAGLAGAWQADSAMQGHDLLLERNEERLLIGLAGRRLVGLRRGDQSARGPLARWERRCARGLPALDGSVGGLSACDVTRYLHWLDRLWFDGRLRP